MYNLKFTFWPQCYIFVFLNVFVGKLRAVQGSPKLRHLEGLY